MSLDQIVTSYRQKLLASEHQSEHAIRSAHSHMLATVQPHLAPLLQQIGEAKAADNPVPLHWLYTGDKLGNAKQLVKGQVNQFGANAKAQVVQAQHQGASLGVQSATAQLGHAAPSQSVSSPGHQTLKPVDNL